VADSLGDAAPLVLDGGACAAGLESTIVALRDQGGWQILRPGPVTEAQLRAVLGAPPDAVTSAEIEAPGQLASHYAPGKPLRLNAESVEGAEFLIGFGPVAGGSMPVCILQPPHRTSASLSRQYRKWGSALRSMTACAVPLLNGIHAERAKERRSRRFRSAKQ
jgi:hypothetical protein